MQIRTTKARHSAFRMPTPVRITGRTSSITNAFVNGIIPCVHPNADEVDEALGVLGMSPGRVECAYCGDPHTEWDHLRPLVRGKQPTGYISEIANLVPSCGKCNQSKGAEPWEVWMTGMAPRSPSSRGIVDMDARVRRLKQYELWREPVRFDFEATIGIDLWAQHWANHERLCTMMRDCEVTAEKIRGKIDQAAREAAKSQS